MTLASDGRAIPSIGARSAKRLSKIRHRNRLKDGAGRLSTNTPPVYISTKRGREALASLHAKAPKEWRPIDRAYRTDWLKHRLREYVNVHGYASAGVCTMLEKASSAYADGDYIRALALIDGNTQLLVQAHRLNQLGKQLELAAYEIAAREGREKRELDALEDKGVAKLAHVLQETREERAHHRGRSHNTTEDVYFGGIKPGPEPEWPGIDGSIFDKQKQPADHPEPFEYPKLDQPRGVSGKFIPPGTDPDEG